MQSSREDPELSNNHINITKVENFEICNELSHSYEKEMNCTRKWNILHMLSGMYAKFLVVIAVISVFTEVLHGTVPLFHIHVYFYFYLLLLSIIIFIINFLSKFLQKCNERQVQLKHECEALGETNCCRYNTHYFLIGIVVSGLATFICACMKSTSVFMTIERCINSFASTLLILHCIFIGLQLGFLLLNVNGLFSDFGCFHKIVVMHLAATNAALWFYMALWESSKDWQEAKHLKHNSSLKWSHRDLNITIHSLESDIESPHSNEHFPKHAVHVTSNCWWRVPDVEISEDILSIQLCLQNSSVGFVWRTSSEILYPIVMQHYLIVIFLLCLIFESTKIKYRNQYDAIFMVHFQNTGFCFNSSKGFLLGLIFLLSSITTVLVYGILGSVNFYFISMVILCITFGLAVCASIIGLMQSRHIPANIIPMNQNIFHSYQEIGLFIVYVYGALNIMSSSFSDKYSFLLLISSLLMILHAICQYFLIIHISTTSIQSQADIKSKQIISFLVLCNATLWILESFIYWKHTDMYPQLKIYGSFVWPIIMRIVLPCLVFYRFNSAIILLETLRFSRIESSKETF